MYSGLPQPDSTKVLAALQRRGGWVTAQQADTAARVYGYRLTLNVRSSKWKTCVAKNGLTCRI